MLGMKYLQAIIKKFLFPFTKIFHLQKYLELVLLIVKNVKILGLK